MSERVDLSEVLAVLEELVDACEWLSLYPEGAVGIEELRETQHKARDLLDRLAQTTGTERDS